MSRNTVMLADDLVSEVFSLEAELTNQFPVLNLQEGIAANVLLRGAVLQFKQDKERLGAEKAVRNLLRGKEFNTAPAVPVPAVVTESSPVPLKPLREVSSNRPQSQGLTKSHRRILGVLAKGPMDSLAWAKGAAVSKTYLYQTIRKLKPAGCVSSRFEVSKGRRRKIFRITPTGRTQLREG